MLDQYTVWKLKQHWLNAFTISHTPMTLGYGSESLILSPFPRPYLYLVGFHTQGWVPNSCFPGVMRSASAVETRDHWREYGKAEELSCGVGGWEGGGGGGRGRTVIERGGRWRSIEDRIRLTWGASTNVAPIDGAVTWGWDERILVLAIIIG